MLVEVGEEAVGVVIVFAEEAEPAEVQQHLFAQRRVQHLLADLYCFEDARRVPFGVECIKGVTHAEGPVTGGAPLTDGSPSSS